MMSLALRTMVLLVICFSSIVLDGAVTSAFACQCGCWHDRKACSASAIAEAHLVVVGKVASAHEISRAGIDPLIVARITVLRVVKGTPPAELILESLGGDNGGNCGMGRYLLEASQKGWTNPFVLGLPKRGRYKIGYCNQVRESELP